MTTTNLKEKRRRETKLNTLRVKEDHSRSSICPNTDWPVIQSAGVFNRQMDVREVRRLKFSKARSRSRQLGDEPAKKREKRTRGLLERREERKRRGKRSERNKSRGCRGALNRPVGTRLLPPGRRSHSCCSTFANDLVRSGHVQSLSSADPRPFLHSLFQSCTPLVASG